MLAKYVTKKQFEETIVELKEKLAILEKRLQDIEADRQNQDRVIPAEES